MLGAVVAVGALVAAVFVREVALRGAGPEKKGGAGDGARAVEDVAAVS
jgi:hypothetical protein